jgi:hypothetical protein
MNEQSVSEAATMVPPQILENLKQHKAHHPDVTCLECGYKGMMGITSDGARFGLSFFIALLLTIGFAPFGLFGFIWSPAIFGFSFIIALQRTAKPVVMCPNCMKELAI